MPQLRLLLLSAALAVAAVAMAQAFPPEVSQAVQSLAQTLQVPATEVSVVRFEEHTWPDSSLGCPRPGQVYTQALVPGYLVILEAAGRTYEYHTDRQGRISCATPVIVRPQEIGFAVEDLAARLQVKPDQIVVQRFEERDWPDASLGCAPDGRSYAPGTTPGYQILLRYGVDEYEYHADRKGRAVYCSRNVVTAADTPPVVELARRQLAEKLGCTVTEVSLVEAPYVDWAPQPLGTPYEPAAIRQARIQPGYRPVFRCRDRQFVYRTDLEREVSLVREMPATAPETYRLAYLELAKDPDGYNLWDLGMRESFTGQSRRLIRNVVDFAVAPANGRTIYLRRMPGDRMTLWGLESSEVPLLAGPDFRALSWDNSGSRYTAWAREIADGPWRLVLGQVPNPPTVHPLDTSSAGPGLPQPTQWQGDLMAYVFDNLGQPTSMLLNVATGAVTPLGEGRFAAWLAAPGEFLKLQDDELIRASLATPTRYDTVARLPGLVWAAPLPDCNDYVGLTQEGGLVRLWTAPLVGQAPPRLVTELQGQFVRAQLSPRGTLLMVQQVAPLATNREECRVTLVEVQTGHQEPLQGVCVRAQLLPPAQQAL